MLNSKLASQFATLLSGRVAAAGIQAVTIYLLARWSQVSEFGLLAAALGVATTVQAVGDGGVTTFAVRDAAARGLTRRTAFAEQLSRLLTGMLVAIGVLTVTVLCVFSGMEYAVLLPLAGWVIADRVSDIRSAMARGLGDVRLGTSNIVVRRVLQLALFTGAYFFGMPAPWAFSCALCLGSVVTIGLMWKRFPLPPQVPLRLATLKHSLHRCFPYWIHSAATQLRNLDGLIVVALSGSVQGGLYGVGARMMTPLRMLPATLGTALLPHLVRRKTDASRAKESVMCLIGGLLLGFPYMLVVVAAPWAIGHLGPGYGGAIVPLQVLCIGLVASSVVSIFTAVLQARGAAGTVALVSTVTTMICLIMVAVGAVLAGAIGAAAGFALSTYLQAVFLIQKAMKHG